MTPIRFPTLYQDRHAFVLGLGDSGLAMAAWAARLGARVTVWDSREQPPQLAALRERLPEAAFVHGEFTPELLASIDHSWVLLKSPGLSPLDARLKPLLARAEEIGLRVRGELELFAQALAELKTLYRYEPGVLAITGTNGKTTTTSMTALLVERAGRRVAMAGNIGPTLLGTLSDALDKEPMPQPKEAEIEAVVDLAVEAVSAAPGSDAAEVPNAEALLAPVDASAEASTETPAEASEEALLEAPIEATADAPVEMPIEAPTEAPVETLAAQAPADERSALEAVAELLDEQPLPIKPPPPKPAEFEVLPQVWVLELSSFQLDGVKGFEPSAGAVLNITQDHLDWHGDMPAYARAKGRIFGEHGVLVINRDDPEVEALVPAPVVVKQGRGRPAKTVEREVVRFGLDAPRRPGDFGLLVENGMAWLVRAREQEEELKGLKRRKDDEDELLIQRLMPADALRVRGRHNAANALAALALASSIGCPLAPMLHGLREYRGEPHRVEFVTAIKGVDFYDDSKGTNVGATVAAVMGLGADRAPAKLVMILGGDGKGQDFSPLATPIALHARAVALIGRDAPQIEAALQDSGVLMHRHESLEAATHWALAQAQSGDSVLLSPACASLDMFRNYAHRAEVFIATVRELAEDEGFVG
ncbi:UDP-N-acetylmuramoylalanine--D-glutamate ligase [Mitsuaria sp. BK045]|uniref:UDP-N-acetylmuramoyl-L-alanine--D-glutamate ligase n=1 Tax=unclassified Roseateles TaxID=2626991 RepID=UPI00183B6C06|nr:MULTISPECIES: UDP-N-acetylmuramoyl-L-alanine--D-glutamate ligase [unclassified Roseateles]MBB3294728.1 UDP-N-acetylmuramoylalanine--D-glutamate ligase [Mitsuaria sp. BK041]MBB3363944.1 UDP-N-acetylmuramoylalanine--D-glutamate ligase [Mitsuaria sp. BK045]